jgi:hypothetical protein
MLKNNPLKGTQNSRFNSMLDTEMSEVSTVFHSGEKKIEILDLENSKNPEFISTSEQRKIKGCPPKVSLGLSESPRELTNKIIRHSDPTGHKLDIFTLKEGLNQLKFYSLGLPSEFDRSENGYKIVIDGITIGLLDSFLTTFKESGDQMCQIRQEADLMTTENTDDVIKTQIGWTLRDISHRIEAMVLQAEITDIGRS